MRHNEEGRQCATNTPRTEARQPGRRRKQRYPEGGTSKTWAKAPKRTIRGGGRATSGREQATKTEPKNKAPTPNVALLRAKPRDESTNSDTLTSGKGGRVGVSSRLSLGILTTVSLPIDDCQAKAARACARAIGFMAEATLV